MTPFIKHQLMTAFDKLSARDRRALSLLAATALPLLFLMLVWLPIRAETQKLEKSAPDRQVKLLAAERALSLPLLTPTANPSCIGNSPANEIIVPSMTTKSLLQCIAEDATGSRMISEFLLEPRPEAQQMKATLRVNRHG